MRLKSENRSRGRTDTILVRLDDLKGATGVSVIMSAVAVMLIAISVSIGMGLVAPRWMELTAVVAGTAALFIFVSALYLKRCVSFNVAQIAGGVHQAQRLHDTDALTGALMRNPFLGNLSDAVKRRRDGAGTVALIVFDIDHFKQINDSFGHPVGDQVLQFCAKTAGAVFHSATVGRMGGDEFALFVEYDAEISTGYLDRTCQEFLSILREGFFVTHRRHSVSASLGVAVAPGDTVSPDELLSFADMALYQSKRGGRGTWRYFRKDILADQRQERFIERELRAAILLQELDVLYQPIVDGDGRLNSVEALVRWQHPVRGRISPAVFVPVAERSRMIHDLGLAVLRRVCKDMHALPHVAVNVNVSAPQLSLAHFKQDYLSVLEAANVPPSRIVIEITESSKLQASPQLLERIAELREAGFRIALDDFGMGYSEFNQLRTMPFDIIKIDKSYIQNLGSDNVTDVFVSAVVSIARHLDRKVIAEGIETRDDRARASVAGCGLFQGFLFDKPLTGAELARHYPTVPELLSA